jgi:uncharacterized protein YbbC (DUF1343 family)
VAFVPLYFTPTASTHRGLSCGGVNLVLTDRSRFQSVLTGLALISALHRLYPTQFDIDKVIRLMGNQVALEALKRDEAPADIVRAAQSDASMRAFLSSRQKALLYER